MKTLILTCNTGQGHNASAAAIRGAFEARGVTCDIADTLAFLSKQISKVIDRCFTGIYRHMPRAFDRGYAFTDAREGKAGAVPITQLMQPGAKRLCRFVQENGYTHILCVHVFSAVMVAVCKEKYGLTVTSSYLPTDYTCYPFTEKTTADAYFLPHEGLAPSYIQAGIPGERVYPTGIPVREDFFETRDKARERAALGMDADAKVVLLMGGSMGCGPIDALVKAIAAAVDENTYLLVSCGTNKRLLRQLSQREGPRVRLLEYADNVPQLMAAADLFVTKPGGISITEAGVSGLPILLLNVIGGCETPNYRYFTERGYAFGAQDVAHAASLCRQLLEAPQVLDARATLLRETFRKDAAAEICRIVGTL